MHAWHGGNSVSIANSSDEEEDYAALQGDIPDAEPESGEGEGDADSDSVDSFSDEEVENDDDSDEGQENGADGVMSLTEARRKTQFGPARDTTPFLRLNLGSLQGIAWHEFVVYDMMHAAALIIKDTVLGTLFGSRWTESVAHVEGGNLFPRRFSDAQMQRGPGCLCEEGKQVFESALISIGSALGGDAARLNRLCDASKSSKSHTLFLLAGPIGLYALACVKPYLSNDVCRTLMTLLQAMHLLWSKELHMASLPTLQALVYEAVCAVELYLPVSERDIKLHVLTEMTASIKNWGR